MQDYKEMYLSMMRATEKAILLLIAAQQECEEKYLSAPESEWISFLQVKDHEAAKPGNKAQPK